MDASKRFSYFKESYLLVVIVVTFKCEKVLGRGDSYVCNGHDTYP